MGKVVIAIRKYLSVGFPLLDNIGDHSQLHNIKNGSRFALFKLLAT